MTPPICPYCHNPAKLTTGVAIYPHRPDLAKKDFWDCKACDAYVGCHGKTRRPLGRLANPQLRAAKMAAHAAFDPMWRDRRMPRSQAYIWLARKLHVEREDCHIGEFDVPMCERVVKVCKERMEPDAD